MESYLKRTSFSNNYSTRCASALIKYEATRNLKTDLSVTITYGNGQVNI